MLNKFLAAVLVMTLGLAVGCTSNRNNTATNDNPPNHKENVAKSLDQAGYSGIDVDYDKDKRVVTLNGRVRSPELKDKAGEVAQQAAPGHVVSNQLSVQPVDQEASAREIEKNVDDAIESNYKAVLVANHLDNQRIRFDAKNGVLTLTGKVKTPEQRSEAQKLAASVPNVQEVVNKIDVDQKGAQQAAEPR